MDSGQIVSNKARVELTVTYSWPLFLLTAWIVLAAFAGGQKYEHENNRRIAANEKFLARLDTFRKVSCMDLRVKGALLTDELRDACPEAVKLNLMVVK